jgi:cysteine synthase A
MGIGDGIIPTILDRSLISGVVTVSDENAVKMARRLAVNEGLACGISSGSNLCGAVALAKKLGEGKRVVTVLPDGAERCFSTPLFE